MEVAKPIATGVKSAGGSCAFSKPRIVRTSHVCARKPSAEPMIAASTAIASSCVKLTVSVNARVAPSVFISATESRCRCT
jgi:hypothetical protein